MRYLLLADADLLAAAHLIVADRGMKARFSLASPASAPAFEAALTLAAQIAMHPQPERLVSAWMSLSLICSARCSTTRRARARSA